MWVLYSAERRKLKSPHSALLFYGRSAFTMNAISKMCVFSWCLSTAPLFMQKVTESLGNVCVHTTSKYMRALQLGVSVPRRRIKLGGRGSIKMQTRWTWRCRLLTFDVILGQKIREKSVILLKSKQVPRWTWLCGEAKGRFRKRQTKYFKTGVQKDMMVWENPSSNTFPPLFQPRVSGRGEIIRDS